VNLVAAFVVYPTLDQAFAEYIIRQQEIMIELRNLSVVPGQ